MSVDPFQPVNNYDSKAKPANNNEIKDEKRKSKKKKDKKKPKIDAEYAKSSRKSMPLILSKLDVKHEKISRITSNEFLELVQSGTFSYQKTQTIKTNPSLTFFGLCSIIESLLPLRRIDTHTDIAITLLGYCDEGNIVGLVKFNAGEIYVDFKGPDLSLLDEILKYLAQILE